MQFTKTGSEYTATMGNGTYTVRKSPEFASQWEASVTSARKFNVGGHRTTHAATTFGTLSDAKSWCADDYAARVN